MNTDYEERIMLRNHEFDWRQLRWSLLILAIAWIILILALGAE